MKSDQYLICSDEFFDLTGLSSLDETLATLETLRSRGLSILLCIPTEVWAQDGNVLSLLAPIVTRRSAVTTNLPEAQSDVKAVSGNLDVSILRSIRKIAHKGKLPSAAARLHGETTEIRLKMPDRTAHRMRVLGAERSIATILGATALSLGQSHARSLTLHLIGAGDVEALALAIGDEIPFRGTEAHKVKSRPTKALRKRLQQVAADSSNILVATDQIGHAHIEHIDCQYSGCRTVNRMREFLNEFLDREGQRQTLEFHT